MPGMKSRNWSNQEDELLTQIVLSHYKNKKSTWNEIAEIMSQKYVGFKKSGKQCRERWTNQLDPQVKGNAEWSRQQNQILFSEHDRLGNKWAQISSALPGRTDNCVKNHFYSTLRKGLRKINNYIETVKRKESLVKTFKNQILNKVLLLSQGKYDEKFQFTNEAKQLSFKLKKFLTEVALETQDNEEANLLKEKVFFMFSEFSRNCRKKKAKKIIQKINQSEQSVQKSDISLQQSKQSAENIQLEPCQPKIEQQQFFRQIPKLPLTNINFIDPLNETYKQQKDPCHSPIIVTKNNSMCKLKKRESQNSNRSEDFSLTFNEKSMIYKKGSELRQGLKPAISQRFSFSFNQGFGGCGQKNFFESNVSKDEGLGQNQLIQYMFKNSRVESNSFAITEQKQISFAQLGFCSGASSSFSLFKPEPEQSSTHQQVQFSKMEGKGSLEFDQEPCSSSLYKNQFFSKSFLSEYSIKDNAKNMIKLKKERSINISESIQLMQTHFSSLKEFNHNSIPNLKTSVQLQESKKDNSTKNSLEANKNYFDEDCSINQ